LRAATFADGRVHGSDAATGLLGAPAGRSCASGAGIVVAVLLASDPGELLCLGKATQMPMAIRRVMPTSPSRLLTVSPCLNMKKERLSASEDVELLLAMQFPTSDGPNVLLRATALAIETDYHLFDTLYHAVALEHDDAVLVTADDRYRRKAEHHGMAVDFGGSLS
jgi:hypothetical protein